MFTPPIRAIFVYLIAVNAPKNRKLEIITGYPASAYAETVPTPDVAYDEDPCK